jgi:PTS system cellobiose-specific IIB component
MKKILLACSAGMSTSLLEENMKKYIKEKKYDISVIALDSASAKDKIDQHDLVLLGPQVRFMLAQFKETSKKNTPIDIIPMQMYGMMDGKATVEFAIALLKDK